MDGLPVYVKMVERGIKSDFDCPVCGEEPESLIHALVSCDFALCVVALARLPFKFSVECERLHRSSAPNLFKL